MSHFPMPLQLSTRESAAAEGPRDALSVEVLSTAAQMYYEISHVWNMDWLIEWLVNTHVTVAIFHTVDSRILRLPVWCHERCLYKVPCIRHLCKINWQTTRMMVTSPDDKAQIWTKLHGQRTTVDLKLPFVELRTCQPSGPCFYLSECSLTHWATSVSPLSGSSDIHSIIPLGICIEYTRTNVSLCTMEAYITHAINDEPI